MISIRNCRQLINNTLAYFNGQGYNKFKVKEEFLLTDQIPQRYQDDFLKTVPVSEEQRLYGYQVCITHDTIPMLMHISVANLSKVTVENAIADKLSPYPLFPAEQMKKVWNELITIFMTNGFLMARDIAYERFAKEA